MVLRLPKRPFVQLPLDANLEEETNPGYRQDTWYNVRIGEIIKDRYQLCTKIGWGDTSTVWLANDLRNNRYRVRELDFLLHMKKLSSDHPGAQNIVTLLDHFRIHRKGLIYICLVTDVLGPNLEQQVPTGLRRLDIDWIKEQLHRLLQAVDYLHTVAHVGHGDIWPPNVLCALSDRQALRELDELEAQQPSDRKIDGDRVIYVSRTVKLQSSHMPVLIDFGNSRLSTSAVEIEHLQSLCESVPMQQDEPYKPQRDFEWIGGMFIGIIEGKTLFKVVLTLPSRHLSKAIENEE
ncbi:kinase-like domain-containing protein [Truncatella angustata]|uniref:non-specific serine/threonine protein kinase n=1 Tax=Truncatella angustata TaxID=152316 RepID=A0A9P9A2A0_9PEZI|nr:kinase-like domain-containing protein [Truncatella angustata]KAH6660481.1 kinase-like domain-containing protein [Truncatella angustata]